VGGESSSLGDQEGDGHFYRTNSEKISLWKRNFNCFWEDPIIQCVTNEVIKKIVQGMVMNNLLMY
jgi:hypothetical protein